MSLWRHLWWKRVYFNVRKNYYTAIKRRKWKWEWKIKKKNKIVKDTNIKQLIKEPKEIKSPNWLDKNKLKEILTVIDSNKFGHKNKIGDLKYIDIKDLVNNIKDNTISEIDAKKRLNTLNIIKNSEIKHKRLIPGQKELLNLFNDLSDIILTDKTLMSSKEENEKLKEEKEIEELKEKKKMKMKMRMRMKMMMT